MPGNKQMLIENRKYNPSTAQGSKHLGTHDNAPEQNRRKGKQKAREEGLSPRSPLSVDKWDTAPVPGSSSEDTQDEFMPQIVLELDDHLDSYTETDSSNKETQDKSVPQNISPQTELEDNIMYFTTADMRTHTPGDKVHTRAVNALKKNLERLATDTHLGPIAMSKKLAVFLKGFYPIDALIVPCLEYIKSIAREKQENFNPEYFEIAIVTPVKILLNDEVICSYKTLAEDIRDQIYADRFKDATLQGKGYRDTRWGSYRTSHSHYDVLKTLDVNLHLCKTTEDYYQVFKKIKSYCEQGLARASSSGKSEFFRENNHASYNNIINMINTCDAYKKAHEYNQDEQNISTPVYARNCKK